MARFPLTLSRHRRTAAKPRLTGPTIRRGKGNGSASTPWEFIRAVEGKFGGLGWDLAAAKHNAKARLFATEADDSLSLVWSLLAYEEDRHPLCWLNPPYANITPWARKCAEEVQAGARVLLLVPASIGANWYWDLVVPYADVYSVGRMVFGDCYDSDGQLVTTQYPKDLILCEYDWPRTGAGKDSNDGIVKRWRWQDG